MSSRSFPLRQWAVVLVALYVLNMPSGADGSLTRGVRRRAGASDDPLVSPRTNSNDNVHTRQYPKVLRVMDHSNDESVGKPNGGVRTHGLSSKRTTKISRKSMIKKPRGTSTQRRLQINSSEGSAETRKKRMGAEDNYDFDTPGETGTTILAAEVSPEEGKQKNKDKNKDKESDDEDVGLGVNGTIINGTYWDLDTTDETIEIDEPLGGDISVEGEDFEFGDEEDNGDLPGPGQDDNENQDGSVVVNAEAFPEDEEDEEESVESVEEEPQKNKDKNKDKEADDEDDEYEEEEEEGGKQKDKDNSLDDILFNATNVTSVPTEDLQWQGDESLLEDILDDEMELDGELAVQAEEDTDDRFSNLPVSDPGLNLIENQPCIELKDAYIFMSNWQSNEIPCMQNPDSCRRGCCRLDDHIFCDEDNEFEDLQCICNFNTGLGGR